MQTIAIVGRPNVGKSALFNRLAGKRIAIVDSTYGLTRDRISVSVTCKGKTFTLVDTGGIDFDVSDNVREMAKRQTRLAIEQADTILFVTDVREGVVPLDSEIATLLREAGKKVIIVANKADNEMLSLGALEFYRLGFQEVFAVSAIHGFKIEPLLDAIISRISEDAGKGREKLHIAVVGKPNVGKSTYVNSVLHEERLIIDEKPGTTRDSVDTDATWRGRAMTIIDTAGMRHKRKIRDAAEYFGLSRSRASIRRSDIVLLLIDALGGVSTQDNGIAQYIVDRGKGCVIAVNKWDLVRSESTVSYRREVWRKMRFFNYVPLIFISAKFGKGIGKSMRTIFYVQEQFTKRISTPILNRVLHEIWGRHEPPVLKDKRPRFYYAVQCGVKPPTFLIYVNRKELIKRTYANYLANGLRRAFGFEGVPLRLEFKNRR
jgi:GTP-binding protein